MNVKGITRSIRFFHREILATLLAILGLLTAIWMLAPEPRATVTIEARPPYEGFKDDYSTSTHERMLRSAEILQPVIEQLNLYGSRSSNGGSPWIADLQVQRLAQSIEVREIPKTSSLEVSFYHRDPQFASNMANAIVVSYAEYRLNQSRKKKADEWAQFVSDLKKTKAQVQLLRQELAELKERGGIVDPDPAHNVTIKEGIDQNSIIAYTAAKYRLLNEMKILEAGTMKYSTERAAGCELEMAPVRIWSKAEPSTHRLQADFRRLWNRLFSPS